jgi:hypothetical protein
MYLSIPLSLVRTPAFWCRLTLPLSYKLFFLTCSSIWLAPSTSRPHDFWIIAQLNCGIAGYDYQSVRRWTTFKRLGYGLVECEKVNCYLSFSYYWTCLRSMLITQFQLTVTIYVTDLCSSAQKCTLVFGSYKHEG